MGFRKGNKGGWKHGKSRTLEYALFHGAKGRAKDQGMEFSLSLEDVVIPEKCPVLGIPITPNHSGQAKPGPNSPTLDRKDNSKGYTKENTWVISFRANALKSDASPEELRALAAATKHFCLPEGLVYLASPYTNPDILVREERFLQAVKACAYAMSTLRINITSAIVFTHPLLTRYTMPVEWEFWAAYDEKIIDTCEEVWVLCLPGFTHSVGTNSEIKLAEGKEKRIRYMVPSELGYLLLDECPKEEDLYGRVMHGRLATERL